MGTSAVDFRGRAYWAHDSGLEVWLQLLADEVDRLECVPPWLDSLRDLWRLMASLGLMGSIDSGLAAHVTDDSRRDEVAALSRLALGRLHAQGEIVTADWLNSLDTGGPNSHFGGDLDREVMELDGLAWLRLLAEAPFELPSNGGMYKLFPLQRRSEAEGPS